MNKIIKASAGTGKTYRLSLEYINALLKGVDFRKIVVMTFTRKATAEIRVRIIEHIEDLTDKKYNSEIYHNLLKINKSNNVNLDNLKTIYQDLLKNKDKIKVHTIDSFINNIFKKSIAPYLGINNFEVTDIDHESAEKVFKLILDDKYTFTMMEDFLAKNTSRKIKDYLNLITDILRQRWKFELIDFKIRQKNNNDDFTKQLDESIAIIKKIAKLNGDKLDDNYFKSNYKIILNNYLDTSIKDKKEEIIYSNYKLFIDSHFWNGNKMRSKNVKYLKTNLENNNQRFQYILANYIFNKELIPYEREVFEFVSKIFAYYDQVKFKEKIFTYSDISNYTYKYLKDVNLNLVRDNKVSDYFINLLGKEIEYLLIDEFQDTSILQWKIIKPIINRTKNIVIVGDEKQSIYGWRGGEKELFANLDQIMQVKVDELRICYRSGEELLNFINKFFATLHPDWNYRKVKPCENNKNEGYTYVLLGGNKCITDTNTKTFKSKSLKEQEEIKKINDQVKTNLKKEIAEKIKIINNVDDLAILARTNNELLEIAEELDKKGIKYILETKSSIIEHEAVKPLYFIFNYLHTNDYLSLLKFLRSNLININHSTLKYFLENKGLIEESLDNEIKEIDEKLVNIINIIKNLKTYEYEEVVHYLFFDTGVFKLYKDNTSVLKNLYYFYTLVSQFNSINELMKFIEENKDSEKLKQVAMYNKDAIRLLTIHKAKGLTFNTVFFYWSPKIKGSSTNNSAKIYIEFDKFYEEVENYLLTNTRYNKVLKKLSYNYYEDEKNKNLMEEINNTYVALTRAANNLLFYIENPRRLNPGNKLCWKSSNYNFYEVSLLSAAGISGLEDLINGKEFGKMKYNYKNKNSRDIDRLNIEEFFVKRTAETSNEQEVILTYERDRKRLYGTIAHNYLEYIKFNKDKEHKLAKSVIYNRYINIIGKEELDRIIKYIKDFITENKKYFAKKYEVYNEYQLYEDDEIIRIDRLLVDKKKKKILILDYKTGDFYKEEQLDRYFEVLKSKIDEDYDISTKFLSLNIN